VNSAATPSIRRSRVGCVATGSVGGTSVEKSGSVRKAIAMPRRPPASARTMLWVIS